MKVVVTGSTGFVGRTLCDVLEARNFEVVRVVHSATGGIRERVIGDIADMPDWADSLEGCNVVVHLAARVHVMRGEARYPLDQYRKTNVAASIHLARQAADVGVKRFVFISSVKVNGEATHGGQVFTADDAPSPSDAYGISKMEAEQGLREIALHTGMEVVIIRPTLVYGPGVKANFATMLRWLRRGIPLPLGAIYNQRSLVALDNLVDLMLTCLTHSAAANQTFMVSDGEDVSTTELLRMMGLALGCPARLIPVPESWLKLGAGFLGKQDIAQRLCGSLQVDISKTRKLLGWTPPLTLVQGLKKVVLTNSEYSNDR